MVIRDNVIGGGLTDRRYFYKEGHQSYELAAVLMRSVNHDDIIVYDEIEYIRVGGYIYYPDRDPIPLEEGQ